MTKRTQAKIERAILQGQIKAARELARFIPDMIRARVKSGEGLRGALKSLSPAYIKLRQRLVSKLSKDTTPGTSNLTATGQLLRAIVGVASGTIVRIFISDKSRRKSLFQSSASNREIRKYVEEQGREFLGLKNDEKDLIIGMAKETIADEIRRVLKTR